MKIGIRACMPDTHGYGRWGENTYRKLKEHGYSYSDFDMADTEKPLYTLPLKEAETMLRHEKTLADQAGIEIFQVHGPWRWPIQDFTPEDRRERMEKMKKSIGFTALLGCKNWVVHPIMPFGIEEKDTDRAAQTWEMNLAFMGELLQTAKEYDVTVCLENMPMPRFSLGTPAEILRFVQTMADDRFKICLDTGHVSVYPELKLEEEVRRLGQEIRVLHVHDNRYGLDLHLMPYLGVIDWKKFADALRDIGFNGAFSLETEPPSKLSDELFDEMGRVLAKIAGSIADGI